jgi:hypothetical protein
LCQRLRDIIQGRFAEISYSQIRKLDDESFRRLTGVLPVTFTKMSKILSASLEGKHTQGGRPNKLCVEDMLLATLEYYREYRTYFHVGQAYGLSESSCYKMIRWVEETLIKSGEFSLPGRKALLDKDTYPEVAMIDVAESPCERPKKSQKARVKNSTTPVRRKDIP